MLKSSFRFTPKGAVKVSDKKSDAVAYLSEVRGKPVAMVFYGKQTKAVSHWVYTSPEKRAASVASAFASRQAYLAAKAAYRAKRAAMGRGPVQVGTLFYSSWGYDQTNIDFYAVVELVGTTMAVVQKASSVDASDLGMPSMTGKVIPGMQRVGKPFRVVVKDGQFKVGGHCAWVWDGSPKYTSSYA